MRHHNHNMNLKKCLIVHSLKLITGGMLDSAETSKIQAGAAENWVTVNGSDAELIRSRRSCKTVKFRARPEKGFLRREQLDS